MTEKEHIIACKRGDLTFFEELYNAHVNDIYAFINYRVRNKEATEDIVGDVFFKALRNIEKCDENQSFRPWIYTIARNTLIDFYRKKKDIQSIDIDDTPDIADEGIDIEKHARDKETLDTVKNAIETLNQAQREIVMMRVWDELSYKEIALITGKTEGNCKMIFSRSIVEIRHLIPLSTLVLVLLSNIEP